MKRYGSVTSMNRLRVNAHIGLTPEERAYLQPLEIEIRFYYEGVPEFGDQQAGQFFCYANTAEAVKNFIQEGEFILIEKTTLMLFDVVRDNIVQQMSEDYGKSVYVWIRLVKCSPPIPYLMEGSSFTYTDLPEGVLACHG